MSRFHRRLSHTGKKDRGSPFDKECQWVSGRGRNNRKRLSKHVRPRPVRWADNTRDSVINCAILVISGANTAMGSASHDPDSHDCLSVDKWPTPRLLLSTCRSLYLHNMDNPSSSAIVESSDWQKFLHDSGVSVHSLVGQSWILQQLERSRHAELG